MRRLLRDRMTIILGLFAVGAAIVSAMAGRPALGLLALGVVAVFVSLHASTAHVRSPRSPENAQRAVRKAVPWILAASLVGVVFIVASAAYYLFVRHDMTLGLIALGCVAYVLWKVSHLTHLWKRGQNSAR